MTVYIYILTVDLKTLCPIKKIFNILIKKSATKLYLMHVLVGLIGYWNSVQNVSIETSDQNRFLQLVTLNEKEIMPRTNWLKLKRFFFFSSQLQVLEEKETLLKWKIILLANCGNHDQSNAVRHILQSININIAHY